MIRGGVVVGLLGLAVASVLLDLAGIPYTAGIQAVVGTLAALSGAVFGARETA